MLVTGECTFGVFDGSVRRAWWHAVALGEQLEMMDKCLHRSFHFGSFGCHDLGVIDAHFTFRHLIQALLDNTQRLSHLFHTAQVSTEKYENNINKEKEKKRKHSR